MSKANAVPSTPEDVYREGEITPYPRFHLVTKIETIKSNWYLWVVNKEDVNGNLTRGTMEADYIGCVAALDTFKANEEQQQSNAPTE